MNSPWTQEQEMLDIMQYSGSSLHQLEIQWRENKNLKEVNVVWFHPAWPPQKPFF